VPISIGWGKKETQFHGKEGKPNLKMLDSQQKARSLSRDDDHKIRLSWRGDGLYFAISLIYTEEHHRTIQIYNRDAILLSTTESVDQLEPVISWR
jgi:elongator complex protein 1